MYWPSVAGPRVHLSSNPQPAPIKAAFKAFVLLLLIISVGAAVLTSNRFQPENSRQPPALLQAGPSDTISASARATRQPPADGEQPLAPAGLPELTAAPGEGAEITRRRGNEHPPEGTERAATQAEAAPAVGSTLSDPVATKGANKPSTDKTAAVDRDSTSALQVVDEETNTRKIEKEIRTAILARAITGVTVSYERNTAYLRGRVKTETQRSAAEQAARSVPGVRNVRSTIQIEWF